MQYVLVFVGCVLLVDGLFGENGLLETVKARQEHQQLQQSLANVRADNARLREEARQLREEAAAVEDLARREHGLIRPGEKLFILKDLEQETP